VVVEADGGVVIFHAGPAEAGGGACVVDDTL